MLLTPDVYLKGEGQGNTFQTGHDYFRRLYVKYVVTVDFCMFSIFGNDIKLVTYHQQTLIVLLSLKNNDCNNMNIKSVSTGIRIKDIWTCSSGVQSVSSVDFKFSSMPVGLMWTSDCNNVQSKNDYISYSLYTIHRYTPIKLPDLLLSSWRIRGPTDLKVLCQD